MIQLTNFKGLKTHTQKKGKTDLRRTTDKMMKRKGKLKGFADCYV